MDKRNFIWLLIVFSIVAGAIIFCTGIPRIELTERDIEINLEHDGYMRDFILHIPKHHENLNKIPLLVALHGGGEKQPEPTAETPAAPKVPDYLGEDVVLAALMWQESFSAAQYYPSKLEKEKDG